MRVERVPRPSTWAVFHRESCLSPYQEVDRPKPMFLVVSMWTACLNPEEVRGHGDVLMVGNCSVFDR